ncbi:MAG TPA: POTRA domain-containing protein, partial [Chitinophagales bacterium]|nr:POTRA domain-containing protein [Chitinophagales bacterium]
MKKLLLIGLLVCVSGSFAQSNNAALFVRNIVINGNKKTKPYVILREMTLRKGDMFSAVKMDSILLQQRL